MPLQCFSDGTYDPLKQVSCGDGFLCLNDCVGRFDDFEYSIDARGFAGRLDAMENEGLWRAMDGLGCYQFCNALVPCTRDPHLGESQAV